MYDREEVRSGLFYVFTHCATSTKLSLSVPGGAHNSYYVKYSRHELLIPRVIWTDLDRLPVISGYCRGLWHDSKRSGRVWVCSSNPPESA